MNASDPLALALRDALRAHAKKAKKKLREAERGDPDGVHDARTALRRARAVLEVMSRTLWDAKKVGELVDRLHEVEKALGPTRDDDVLLEDARAHAPRAVAKRLAEDRAREADRLRRAVRSNSTTRAMKALRALAREDGRWIVLWSKPTKPRPARVRHVMDREAWRAYAALDAFDDALAHHDDPETLHAMRARCRAMRYLLELLGDAAPGGARLAERLRRAQDALGSAHDLHVAIDRVERMCAKGELSKTPAIARYLASCRERAGALQKKARYGELLGAGFRRELARALGET